MALIKGVTGARCHVLRGTGGVGKTQLAAHYARRAWQAGELDVLVWITASSRPAIISAYAQAAEDLLATEPGDPERSANHFLALLDRPEGTAVCRWLIVLDDVTDPADLKGLFPPESPHGHTLITTRRRDAALPGQRIDLGLFNTEQATDYVTESGLLHDRVTSELACPVGRVGRMSLCPSPIRKSSAKTSCESQGTAARV
ncbi:NB-ARC domain-containing protein [Streptomyces sp. PA03-1a]|nr:NB-ARC domain-containing protein [Streptomyces sp. PA03-1a]